MRYKKCDISSAPCYKNNKIIHMSQVTEKQCGSTEDRSISFPKVSRSFLRKSFFQKREVRGSQTEKQQEPLLSFHASHKSKIIGHNVYGKPTHTHTYPYKLLTSWRFK